MLVERFSATRVLCLACVLWAWACDDAGDGSAAADAAPATDGGTDAAPDGAGGSPDTGPRPDQGPPPPDQGPPAPDGGADEGVPDPDMAVVTPDEGVVETDMAVPDPDMGSEVPDMAAPDPDMDVPAPDAALPEPDAAPPVDQGPPAPDQGAPGPLSCPQDDPREDDDEPATATPLGGEPVEGILCGADLDTFSVAVPAGCTLRATARFAHRDGDINLRVLAADGEVLAAAVSVDDDEVLTYLAPADDTYFIQLNLVIAGANTYAVEAAVECPEVLACPGDDHREPDDDAAAATPLALDTPAEGIACGADEDWFAVEVGENCTLTAELDFVHAAGDLDLRVVDAEGQVRTRATGTADGELAEAAFAAAGTAYVVVHLKNGMGGNTYTLTTRERCDGVLACPADDAFEDNDSFETARPLPPGGRVFAVACGADEDFYRVPARAGCTLDAELAFSHAVGDLDLYLLGPDGRTVATSETLEDVERIGHVVRGDGDYALRVALIDGAASIYALDVSLDCPPPPMCADDVFEENDDAASARDLPVGVMVRAVVCGDDEDWYAVEVEADCRLQATADFARADGDLDLEIRDAEGRLLASGNSPGDGETAGARVAAAGAYHVRVLRGAGGGAESVPYGLRADVSCGEACAEDDWEENDAPATAAEWPGHAVDGILCAGDDDYYVIDAPTPGCTLRAHLDFAHADGDLDLRLLGPDGLPLAVSGSASDGEAVERVLEATGSHYLQVYLIGAAARNGYRLDATLECPAPLTCPADDAGEQDDDLASATPLLDGDSVRGIQCAGDPDYFAIEARAGCTVEATLRFRHADGDLDLTLLDPQGVEVLAGRSASDDEHFQSEPLAAGIHYLRVDGAENTYLLRVDRRCPDDLACPDNDAGEDDDDPAAARPLAIGSAVEGIICGSDPDYYAVEVQASCTLVARLSFEHDEGDLNLRLQDAAEHNLDSSTGFGDVEQAAVTPLEPTTVYVRVEAFGEGVDNTYRLTVDERCPEDRLVIHELDAGAGFVELVNIGVAPVALDGLALQLLDGAGVEYGLHPLGGAGGTVPVGGFLVAGPDGILAGLREEVQRLALPAGALRGSPGAARVVRHEGGAVVGVLDAVAHGAVVPGAGEGPPAPADPAQGGLSRCPGGTDSDDNAADFLARPVTPGEANSCPQLLTCPEDDAFEDNDDELSAAPLVPDGQSYEAILCAGEEDWFSFVTRDGCTARVIARFVHAEGDIDLQVLDPGLVVRGTSATANDVEQVVVPTGDGLWLVRVVLAGESNPYTLSINLEGCPPLPPEE